MPTGSCMCGSIRYTLTECPKNSTFIACHCLPCRKTSGTPCSYNLLLPSANVEVTSGTPKTFTRKGDSGKDVTYHFCGYCPSLLYVTIEVLPGMTGVKVGTLDGDGLSEALGDAGKRPDMEAYIKHRFVWAQEMEGVEQRETM